MKYVEGNGQMRKMLRVKRVGVVLAVLLVIVLSNIDEAPVREIAEGLELSIGTVKSRVAYGLSTLRRRLNV